MGFLGTLGCGYLYCVSLRNFGGVCSRCQMEHEFYTRENSCEPIIWLLDEHGAFIQQGDNIPISPVIEILVCPKDGHEVYGLPEATTED